MHKVRSIERVLLGAALVTVGALGGPGSAAAQQAQIQPPTSASAQQASVYWGAFVDGWPEDFSVVNNFEKQSGKKVSVVQWGAAWVRNGNAVWFQRPYFDTVRAHGAIPLLDWGAWDSSLRTAEQPDFTLAHLADGTYDDYITQWADQARDWGHPFFLRLNPEMNGWWQPWSEQVNGNHPGEFVVAWQHIVDIFRQEGANNVTWVWCPNIHGQYSSPMEGLYPGDDYVDWTCMDGYNWGTDHGNSGWWSLTQVFQGSSYTGNFNTYQELQDLAPSKPIMIGETASSENGGSKADWISQALGPELSKNFPLVKAILWFDTQSDDPTLNWPIDSSPEAQAAFAKAIAAPTFAAGTFSNLSVAPIPPPEALTAVAR